MIAYVDSSVLLRIVLGQPGHLREWASIERGIASSNTLYQGIVDSTRGR